jgi:hypothetical protein
MAGPRVVAGIGDDPGADGVQLDVAVAGEHICLAAGDARPEPALPRRSGPPMEIVDPPDMAAAEAIHQPRGPLGAGRRQQEVDVVGHEDLGVERAADIGGDLREIVEIGAPVGIFEEAGLAIDAALHEMDRHAGKHETRPARHPPMFRIRPGGGQGVQSRYAGMRRAYYFVLVVRIDLSARGEGCWSVMWRRLLWPGKPRWIVICWIVICP